mmetsp:Transcript_25925/g.78830  ORF Transcript_25925/g.78830 Transcript_25925/m.78830 type:complete len:204 (-) Transcript_25925:1370-1981(-)
MPDAPCVLTDASASSLIESSTTARPLGVTSRRGASCKRGLSTTLRQNAGARNCPLCSRVATRPAPATSGCCGFGMGAVEDAAHRAESRPESQGEPHSEPRSEACADRRSEWRAEYRPDARGENRPFATDIAKRMHAERERSRIGLGDQSSSAPPGMRGLDEAVESPVCGVGNAEPAAALLPRQEPEVLMVRLHGFLEAAPPGA